MTRGSQTRRTVIAMAAFVVAIALLWRGVSRPAVPAEPVAQPADEARLAPTNRAARTTTTATTNHTESPVPSRNGAIERDASATASEAAAMPADFNERLPNREVPIPGFRPEPGAQDPGPGPYMALYHGRSGQLSPSARPNGTEVTTPNESMGPPPVLTVWVPSVRVQAGAPVVIHATLRLPSGAVVPAEAIGVAIVREGESPSGALIPMVPAPAGSTHDYEYRYTAPQPDGGVAGAREYRYAVQARGAIQGTPFERAASGGFTVHAATGRTDSRSAQVQRDGGNLTLTLRVTLEQAGTYWAYAELWGGDGGTRPIAFARERWERQSVGEHAFTLTFGGLLIRDSEIDGPYTVRNVRFMQVDTIPPNEQEPIAQLPPTPAWRASEFF